jgi:hypothetical protein
MKIKLIGFALICGLVVLVSGCYTTVDGRSKAGVPFKKDKIEGRYERSVAQVFEASKVVLNRLGKIISADVVSNILAANVDTRNVWVKVTEVDTKVSAVTVQVRTKGGGADLDLAHQIEKEIALHLATLK